MADEVKILIKGDDADLQRALKGSEKSVKGFGAGVKKVMIGLGIAVAAKAIISLGKQAFAFGKSMLDLFNEQEKAEARIGAVLKATGEAAGFNKQQMLDMASAMQQVTVHGDEMVLGAQAIIATFRNITGDQFKDTLMLAADLADVMQVDLKSAAMQLGKALNDPAKGMTMLTRAGVTFTDSQKEQVKALQESGDMIGAQRVILKELENQFGGAAAAAANTFGGKMTQMKNRLGDAGEKIGKALIPVLELIAPILEKALVVIENAIPAFTRFVEGLVTVVKVFWNIFAPIVKAWAGFWGVMLGEFTEVLAEMPKIAQDKKDAIVKEVGDIAKEATDAFNNNFKPSMEGLPPDIPQAGIFDPLTDPGMVEQARQEGAKQATIDRFAKQRQDEKDIKQRKTAFEAQLLQQGIRGVGDFFSKGFGSITKGISEVLKSELPGEIVAGVQEFAAAGEKRQGRSAAFEDLVGLNRRITQAAASTPEDKVVAAVFGGAEKQVKAVEKVDKSLQKQIDQQEKFNKMVIDMGGLAP